MYNSGNLSETFTRQSPTNATVNKLKVKFKMWKKILDKKIETLKTSNLNVGHPFIASTWEGELGCSLRL